MILHAVAAAIRTTMTTQNDIIGKLKLDASQWNAELNKVTRSIKGGIGITASQSAQLVTVMRQIAAEAAALQAMSSNGIIRKFVSDDAGNVTVELTDAKALIESTAQSVEATTKAWHENRDVISQTLQQVTELESQFARPTMQQATERLAQVIRRLSEETNTATGQLKNLQATTGAITPPVITPKIEAVTPIVNPIVPPVITPTVETVTPKIEAVTPPAIVQNVDVRLPSEQWQPKLQQVTRSLKGGISMTAGQSQELVRVLSNIHSEANAIARISENGLVIRFTADDAGKITTELVDINQLIDALRAKVRGVTDSWRANSEQIDGNIRTVDDLRKMMLRPDFAAAGNRLTQVMRQVQSSTTGAANEVQRMQNASSRGLIPAGGSGSPPDKVVPGVRVKPPTVNAVIKVNATETTQQTKAITKAFHAVSNSIDQTSRRMFLYRQMMQAPIADRNHNVLAQGIQGTGNAVASTVEFVRSRLDAVLSFGSDSVKAGQDVLQQFSGTASDVSNTLGKWIYKAEQALDVTATLGNKFPHLKETLEAMRGPLAAGRDALNDLQNRMFGVGSQTAKTTANINGLAFVATGKLAKLSGEAGLYERATLAANLPVRAAAVVAGIATSRQELLTKALNFSLYPLRRVNDLWQENATVNRLAREELDRLEPKAWTVSGVLRKQASTVGDATAKWVSQTKAWQAGSRIAGTVAGRVHTVSDAVRSKTNAVAQSVQQWVTQSRVWRTASQIAGTITNTTRTAAAAVGIFTGRLWENTKAWATSRRTMYTAFQVLNGIRIGAKIVTVPLGLVASGFTAIGRKAIAALTPTGAKLKGVAGALKFVTYNATNLASAMASGASAVVNSVQVMQASMFGLRKTIAGVKSAGSGLLNVVGGIGGKAAYGALALKAAAVAGIAWGASLATAAETSQTSFETMFRDANTAKAVMESITKFSAATPFAKSDLIETGQILATAQVPADQLIDKIRVLGDIAAGTGKPIEEFATIFAKVKNTGKLGLEQINQLAERNVPIYGALADSLGVSRDRMLEMVSDGELGFNDLEKALTSLTTGTGQFAGGMERQSKTTAGLLSTLKDNIAITFETLSGALMDVFNVKEMLSMSISITQKGAELIKEFTPALTVLSDVARSGFFAIKEAAGIVWTAIFGEGSTTISNLMTEFVTLGAVVSFGFQEWPNIAGLVFKQIALSSLSTFNSIAFFFTDTMPAALSWFGNNWSRLFMDIANWTGTVFTNLFTNIRSVMSSVWEFIKSGGTQSLSIAWTPLTEGFKATVDELKLPERVASDLEKSIADDIQKTKTALGNGLESAVEDAINKMNAAKKSADIPVEITAAVAAQSGRIDEINTDSSKKDKAAADRSAAENKAVSLRSSESASLIASIFKRTNEDKASKALKAAQVNNQHAKEIEDNTKKIADKMPGFAPAGW